MAGITNLNRPFRRFCLLWNARVALLFAACAGCMALSFTDSIELASGASSRLQGFEGNPPIANPHGDLVFRATKTTSCMDCHRVDHGKGDRVIVLENAVVRGLIAKGKGAHSGGRFADCFRCHAGGRKGVENY